MFDSPLSGPGKRIAVSMKRSVGRCIGRWLGKTWENVLELLQKVFMIWFGC